MEKSFKGVWIPSEIYCAKDLLWIEKFLYVEIDYLDTPKTGCYATNEYFSKLLNCSERYVTKIISNLIAKGYIRSEPNSDQKRILKSNFCYKRGVERQFEGGRTPVPETPNASSLPFHIIEVLKEGKVNTVSIKNKEYLKYSNLLKGYIKKISPEAIISENQALKWAEEFRKMVEIDHRKESDIIEIMDKVFSDGEFWGTVIRSASKLRKNWNDGKLSNLGNSVRYNQNFDEGEEPVYRKSEKTPEELEIERRLREKRGNK